MSGRGLPAVPTLNRLPPNQSLLVVQTGGQPTGDPVPVGVQEVGGEEREGGETL